MATLKKDPDETRDLTLDWSDFLGPNGINDTITSVVWTVDTGLTKGAQSNTTTKATVRLSGGTAGVRYNVACKITTAGGQIAERTTIIRVRQL